MLKGRLGLEGARVPQADRHGLLWLGRGNLTVDAGALRFVTAGGGDLAPGDYALPFQMLSCVVLEPGTTVSHDALRLLARHGTGLAAVGEGGVRFYASMPFGPDSSARARRQVELWSHPDERVRVVRRMYAWRLGEVVPVEDLTALRGIEGARVKVAYRRMADQFDIPWAGRKYDRNAPQAADLANQAINHAAPTLQAAAQLAVAVTGTIPQLGFIHEDSGIAFALDVADLFREEVLLPIAFGAVREVLEGRAPELERAVRQSAGRQIRKVGVVPKMIDRIKELIDVPDGGGDA